MNVDWGAGSYETTAAIELAPAADAVVEAAGVADGEDVLDLACGSGNAALVAARRGARVIGTDAAPRLLAVAAERAKSAGLELDLREGDLLTVPVADAGADVVVSVFGVIFAADPVAALGEIRRILRPQGRAVISAWVPAGPIDAMLAATARIAARVSGAPPQPRFAWSDPAVLAPTATAAGLALSSTDTRLLPIRAGSVEEYVDRNRAHPMAVAAEPMMRAAGVMDEVREAQLAALRDASEDGDGFLVHSPYAVHVLRPV